MKLLLIAALLCLPAAAQTNQPKVIVISLDGFPAFALDDPKLPIPTLRKLMANGISGPMTAINPTVTWRNHTTMVTGVRADEHGLLANGAIMRTGAWPPVKVEPLAPKRTHRLAESRAGRMSRWRFDAMIACSALVTGMPLVHNNAADFETVRTAIELSPERFPGMGSLSLIRVARVLE